MFLTVAAPEAVMTPEARKRKEELNRRKKAAQARKAAFRAKRAKKADAVTVVIRRPAGTKVTVVVEDQAPKGPEPVSAVKKEALDFENNPYALAYRRPEPPYAKFARRGVKRVR